MNFQLHFFLDSLWHFLIKTNLAQISSFLSCFGLFWFFFLWPKSDALKKYPWVLSALWWYCILLDNDEEAGLYPERFFASERGENYWHCSTPLSWITKQNSEVGVRAQLECRKMQGLNQRTMSFPDYKFPGNSQFDGDIFSFVLNFCPHSIHPLEYWEICLWF